MHQPRSAATGRSAEPVARAAGRRRARARDVVELPRSGGRGGTVLRRRRHRDLIPLSDGAGDVIAVGSEVTRFKVGARVAATFFQPGPQPMALGSPLDGMLAERVALYEDGLVSIPEHLSYEEAACLPCASVTAWHALFHAGRPLKAGDTVLVLGTGGVSIAALQFAKAAGARVIATSSSDAKPRARRRSARPMS